MSIVRVTNVMRGTHGCERSEHDVHEESTWFKFQIPVIPLETQFDGKWLTLDAITTTQ
jgi:hypothetical protein